MQKITPFLWFDGNAEEAMNFYLSVFKNSKAVEIKRAGGKVIGAIFELEGQSFMALNGGPAARSCSAAGSRITSA